MVSGAVPCYVAGIVGALDVIFFAWIWRQEQIIRARRKKAREITQEIQFNLPV